MLGVYFSGTGNTAHCVKTFISQFGEGESVCIESPACAAQIVAHECIVLGYPVYFSNAPKIMRDFISANQASFMGKHIYIIATMGLFSGDGTGCTARLLKKCGARILGGLHLKMPDCIGDEKLLKKTPEENRSLIAAADKKIVTAAEHLKAGQPDQEGLGFFYHMAGLFGQRLWFYGKTNRYHQKPVVDSRQCIGCGKCVALCPMHNLELAHGKVVSHDRCTLCYRCFSHCPTQALTILGKKVYEQCLFARYQAP